MCGTIDKEREHERHMKEIEQRTGYQPAVPPLGAGPAPSSNEARHLRDRIRFLREAIRVVGRGGLTFVERYTPRYKRGEPRPESLPVPGAQAWVNEVLAQDDALGAARAAGEGAP